MVLSGVASDPVQLRKLALQLVSRQSDSTSSALTHALTKRSR
jgi:hypothetical protein